MCVVLVNGIILLFEVHCDVVFQAFDIRHHGSRRFLQNVSLNCEPSSKSNVFGSPV